MADEYSNFSFREKSSRGGRGTESARQIASDVLIGQIMNVVQAGKIGFCWLIQSPAQEAVRSLAMDSCVINEQLC